MRIRIAKLSVTGCLSWALLATAPATALAQAADDPAAVASPAKAGVEEIVVTARKRDEALIDVPMAITTFSGVDLDKLRVRDVTDLAFHTPGLTVAPLFGGLYSTATIRGLMTTIGEPNVGFFVDGVYQASRTTMITMLGNEVERVEIARGPQSALYGRNTFGGAVNVISRPPSDDFEGTLDATYGNYNQQELRIAHSGPVVRDLLHYRAGFNYGARNGFYENEIDPDKDQRIDDRRTLGYALSLELRPTSDFNAVARAAYEDSDNGDFALRYVENNAYFFAPLNDNQSYSGQVPSYTEGYAVTPGRYDRNNLSSSLALNWDFPTFRATAITGYNDLREHVRRDRDYEAREIRWATQDIKQGEMSQEVRLTSAKHPRHRWMVGAYYYRVDAETDSTDEYVGMFENFPGILPGSASTASAVDEKNESYSAFFDVGLELFPRTMLSLSSRYEREHKKVDAVDTMTLSGASASFSDEATFTLFTPKAALDVHVTDGHVVYASVARGMKSGGFNVITTTGLVAPDERNYDPEASWNYEIGAKTEWLDRRISLNVALFHIRWEDQIVRALGQNGAVLNVNAAQSTSQGFEIEARARPISSVDVRGSVAYTDAHYDKYQFDSLTSIGLDPNLDGVRIYNVSEWMASGSAEYTYANIWQDFGWVTGADVSYRSDQTVIQVRHAPRIAPVTLVQLRTGIENHRYGLTLWAKNLLDDATPRGAIIVNNPTVDVDRFFTGRRSGLQVFQGLVTAPEPRTFGATAQMRF